MITCLYCGKRKKEYKLAFCSKCNSNLPEDEKNLRIKKYNQHKKSIRDYFDRSDV